MEGTCLCGRVAVKVNDDNLFGTQRRGHICHCANCRKVAGGIFGVNLIIEESKVEFPKGKDSIKVYKDGDTLSGHAVERHFCENCGVPIMSVAPRYGPVLILKLGLYPKLPRPEWESFCNSRQEWEEPLDAKEIIQYSVASKVSDKMPGSI